MDAATIPDPVVALAQELADGLRAWAREHQRATLAEHEQGVLALRSSDPEPDEPRFGDDYLVEPFTAPELMQKAGQLLR